MTHHHEEEIDEEPAAQHVHTPRHRYHFFRHLIVSLIINIGALAAVLYLVKGISLAPELSDSLRLQLKTLLIAGILMGLANGILKPILKFFTFPLIILTLGLTLLAINWFVFWLVVSNTDGIVVTGGATAYFWGSVIFSIVNTLEHWIFRIRTK